MVSNNTDHIPRGQDPITRWAKISIFIMTPMIIVGLLVMIGTIAFRLVDSDPVAPLDKIVVDSGLRVVSAVQVDGKIQILVATPDGAQALRIYDGSNGQLIRSVQIVDGL